MPTSAVDILITPTARLARQLARDQAVKASSSGQTAWLPTRVATFNHWLQQLRQDQLLLGQDEQVPITSQQAQVLWHAVIEHEIFVGEPQVANLAQQAWRTIHEYGLRPPGTWPELLLSEDSRRFQHWSDAYLKLCNERGLIDEWAFAAALPELIRSDALAVPERIELVGFDLPMTPLQRNILAACETIGSNIVHRRSQTSSNAALNAMECLTDEDELRAAAEWARTLLLQHPEHSIAVVVPDLTGRVDQVERVFRQTFDPPSYTLEPAQPEAWHISLGKPLSQWPLVSTALSLLQLAPQRITQPQAHQLLLSPFVQGGLNEASAREQTLATLVQRAPFAITVAELQWLLKNGQAELLADALDQWQTCRQQSRHNMSASAWVAQFQAELTSLGFAGGRSLDSREYQILNRWHDVLEAFATLDLVTDSPLSRQQALTLLAERAGSVVFRERNVGAPVEILGVEEALGSRFDALWITSLDSDTWPGPTRRNALIPAALQAHVPRASSDACLTRATAELSGLLSLAPLVRGSFAGGSEEVPAQVTSLIGACEVTPQAVPDLPGAASMLAPEEDERGPPLSDTTATGGTGVLRKQSSCPFRAFAEHRLGAVSLQPPRPGLDAGQRGTITHKALEHFFRGIADSAALQALSPAEQNMRIEQAVSAALDDFSQSFRLTLGPAGRRLEQTRTERVLSRWLDIERRRGSFRIRAHEQRIKMQIGKLTLRGSIDRLDELADGSTLLIDYKTGRSAKSDWFPEPRMIDPQLPAYAVNMDEPPQAIAFAYIRPEHLRFEGLSAEDAQTPGIGKLEDESYKYKSLDDWQQLLTDWHTHISNLGYEFVQGHAQVDPRSARECTQCHLHGVCRVLERAPFNSLNEDQDGV